ncbi:hypothetical protein NQ176_g5005 [Zarea fungicola]|uniref:Uncharacterized protein n=1 Tax=Zarea fungicola TaxID=93591 RepID=A0ACC1NAP5_9HYPO|nr:hypothetical protein NQ176_g5005 [Lecanicillium fungicola]
METGQGDGVLNLFCRRDETPLIFGNLSGLRVASAIDFGPAVVPNGDGSRASGAVVSHYKTRQKTSLSALPALEMLDQNEAGYFVYCDAPQKTWAMIMREIGADKTSSRLAN